MKKLISLATVALVAFAGSAFAATATTNVTVSATVTAACTASTSTNISFGTLDPVNDSGSYLASVKGNAGAILVKCTQGTNYTLSAPATANMANGANNIAYAPALPVVPANDGAVVGKSYTIDATVAQADYAAAPAGAYTGNLVVTVNY